MSCKICNDTGYTKRGVLHMCDVGFLMLPQVSYMVAHSYIDSDGYWIEMKRGFTADPRDAHDIREDTPGRAIRRLYAAVTCDCNSCTL